MASNNKDTLDEQWLRRLKNHPIVAGFIVAGAVIIWLALVTDSTSKIVKVLRAEPSPTQAKIQSREVPHTKIAPQQDVLATRPSCPSERVGEEPPGGGG